MSDAKQNAVISYFATGAGIGLKDINDIGQFVAIIIAIVSGLLAVKHYITAIRLNNLKIKQLNEDNQSE